MPGASSVKMVAAGRVTYVPRPAGRDRASGGVRTLSLLDLLVSQRG
jgi:hypothetical protein